MNNREQFLLKLSLTGGFGDKAIRYIFERSTEDHLSLDVLADLDVKEFSSLFPELGSGRLSRAKPEQLFKQDGEEFENIIKSLEENSIGILSSSDEQYPKLLLDRLASEAPPILFSKGNIDLLNTPSVAIIGHREATIEEIEFTTLLSQTISSKAYTIVSGYARGIDVAAHLGAIDGDGNTIMVLSTGILTPPTRIEFDQEIPASRSLFISQFSPQQSFNAYAAMARNKVIVALAESVIVIATGSEKSEHGKQSGTFNAAAVALELRTPLYVRQYDSMPTGNSELIERGGVAFESINDLSLIPFLR